MVCKDVNKIFKFVVDFYVMKVFNFKKIVIFVLKEVKCW